MISFIIENWVPIFWVATAVMAISHALFGMEEDNLSVGSVYRQWQYARRDNNGSLERKKKERLLAIRWMYSVYYWTRTFYWPLILPVYFIIWTVRFVIALNQFRHSVSGK
jgi:hypothetical protein